MYDAVLKLIKYQKVFSFLNNLRNKFLKVFALDQGFDRQ